MATPVYNFTELPSDTAERVAYNETLRILEGINALVRAADVNVTAHPSSPVAGQVVLLAAPATGTALGFDGNIAVYDGIGWRHIGPQALTGPVATEIGFRVPNTTLDGWDPYVAAAAVFNIGNAGVSTSRNTLAADLQLTATSATHHYINPGGAPRDIILPDPATISMAVTVTAIGGTSFPLNIRETAVGATIISLVDAVGSIFKVECVYDGVEWQITAFGK